MSPISFRMEPNMTKNVDLRKLLAHLLPSGLRKFVPPRIARHLYFNGTFSVTHRGRKLLDLQATGYVLENEIYFYGLEGGHEKRSMQIWIEYCEKFKPQQVYDVGASTGIYGLVAKALDQSTEVSFFEPIAKAVEILCANLQMNHFAANVFGLALSNYDGEGHFFMSDASDFAYSVTLNTFGDLAITGSHKEDLTLRKIETPVTQVSTLLASKVIRKPNLVKLDVETHEREVLEGFHFDLNEVDAFLVEVLNEEAAAKLNDLFDGLGFQFFNVDDSKNIVRKTDAIQKSDRT